MTFEEKNMAAENKNPGLRKWKEIEIKHVSALGITVRENNNDEHTGLRLFCPYQLQDEVQVVKPSNFQGWKAEDDITVECSGKQKQWWMEKSLCSKSNGQKLL